MMFDHRKKLLERLDDMEANPDSYIGPSDHPPEAPNKEAFRDARMFINALPPNIPWAPSLYLLSDGEVYFCWQSTGYYLDLGFFGDGEGGSYFGHDASTEIGCDEFDPARLPDELLDMLATRMPKADG